jgi:uncharacterized phage protein (TIGR01671 family)
MREISFRGKFPSLRLWNYGYLIIDSGITYIDDGIGLKIEVDPETIGQYTGLKDKNNIRIFEGDIVREGGETGVIKYSRARFIVNTIRGIVWNPNENCEIIGNICDNPELLKKGE